MWILFKTITFDNEHFGGMVFLIQLESILGNKYSILILDKRPSE